VAANASAGCARDHRRRVSHATAIARSVTSAITTAPTTSTVITVSDIVSGAFPCSRGCSPRTGASEQMFGARQQVSGTGACDQATDPDPASSQMATQRELKMKMTEHDALTFIRNMEQAHPEFVQMRAAYRVHIMESRRFSADGEYGLKSLPRVSTPAVDFYGSQRAPRLFRPCRGSHGRKPIRRGQ
jgi:uncharacterized protein (DUF2384 family)